MKKRFVMAMLAAQLAFVGMVGCADNNNDSANNETAQQESKAETAEVSQQQEINGFDFDRAISGIAIDGENIHLPTTLNELGDEYSFSESRGEFEHDYGKTEAYYLTKDDNVVASVSVLQNEKINIRDNPIIEFNIKNEHVSIEGIKLGDNIEKVKEMYGEPTEFRMDTRPIILGDSYLYIKQEGDNIEFSTDEKGEIMKIYINIKGSLQ